MRIVGAEIRRARGRCCGDTIVESIHAEVLLGTLFATMSIVDSQFGGPNSSSIRLGIGRRLDILQLQNLVFDFDATISPQRQSDLTIIRQQRLDAECDYSILPAAKATFLSAIMATSQRIMVLGRSASSERLQRSVTTSARSWSAIVRFFMDDHRPFISTSTKTQRDRSPGPRCTIRVTVLSALLATSSRFLLVLHWDCLSGLLRYRRATSRN